MKTFTLNGKEIKAKEIDFNLICDLEDLGISIEEIGERPMSFIRAYISFCIGKGKDYAGKEIQNHMINGGNLEEVMTVLNEMMEASDFFRSMSQNKETAN